MQSNNAAAIWAEYEDAQRDDDAATGAGDFAAAEMAADRMAAAYQRFAYAHPQTKEDIVLKLEQCARWILANEGSNADWPGLAAAVDRLNEARQLVEAGVEDIRPVALVRLVWREMSAALGEGFIDTIMVQTTLAGMSREKSLRLV